MSRKYIVSHAGQELGPFSDNELRRMVKSHELLPIDYIYDEDKKDWVMIGERIDLHAEPAPSASPTLPGTNLPASNIHGTNLPGLTLPGAAAPGTDFPAANSPAAGFSGVNLPGSNSPGSALGSANRGDELPPPASVIMRKNSSPQQSQQQFVPQQQPTHQQQPYQAQQSQQQPLPAKPQPIQPTKSISLPPPQTSIQSQPQSQPQSQNQSHSQPLPPTQPHPQLAKPVGTKLNIASTDEDSPTQTQAKIPSSPSPATFDPGRIKFKGGVGEISLDPRVAGTIHLGIKECSTSGVSLPPQAELTVQSAPAKNLLWNLRGQVPAGEELKVEIVAKDDFDNVAKSFSASFEVHSNHPNFGKIPVDVVAGFGQFKVQLTLAGQFQFELKALAPNSLHLPSVTAVTVRPGRPVKLIMDAPKEVVAGQSLSVLVKAVDAFGNLVTDYEGDAAIDIKAS